MTFVFLNRNEQSEHVLIALSEDFVQILVYGNQCI